MVDLLFNTLRWVGRPFAFKCVGFEHVLPGEPGIFVANHLGSVGPLAVMLSTPRRLFPWVIADMMDFQRAPDYLYLDFIEPALHLHGPMGKITANILSKIAVRLLRGIGSISIDRSQGVFLEPYHKSLALLVQVKSLAIFPEDPHLPENPENHLHPFMCGFLLLCGMYYRTTGRQLPLYPTRVAKMERKVYFGPPMYLAINDLNNQAAIRRLCGQLREAISYLDLSGTD